MIIYNKEPNEINVLSVSIECSCLPRCSYLKFVGDDEDIYVDVATSNFTNLKRLKKFVKQVHLTYKQLIKFCSFIAKFAREAFNDQTSVLIIENNFVLRITKTVNIFNLVFYLNEKDHNKNKYCYDLTATQEMLKEFAINLATTFRAKDDELKEEE